MRAPQHPFQGLSRGVEAQQTFGAGSVDNAGPISEAAGATAAALASTGDVSDVEFFWDSWTLTGAGPLTKTLSFLPLIYSEHVYLNGLQQLEGVDWSRTDQTLNVLSAMDARSGDVLECRYAYLTGLPVLVTDGDLGGVNVPYGSTGWKWLNVADAGIPSGWEQPSFDDSAWSIGQGGLAHTGWAAGTFVTPFTGGGGAAGSTAGVHTDVGAMHGTTPPPLGHDGNILIRRLIAPGTGITVTYDAYGGYPTVYVNGTAASTSSTGGHVAIAFNPADQSLPWLLAILVRVGNGNTFGAIDVNITGTDL